MSDQHYAVIRLYGNPAVIRSSRSPAPVDRNQFKPTISRKASTLDRSVIGISASDRLYAEAELGKQKHELLQNEIEEVTRAECTFSPQINSVSRSQSRDRRSLGTADASSASVDILSLGFEDRQRIFAERVSSRRENYKLVKESLELADVTFRPHIPKKTLALAKAKEENTGPVHERLTALALEKKRAQAVAAASAAVAASNALRAKTPPSRAGPPVHERLLLAAKMKQDEFDQEKQKLQREREKELTFKPQLRAKSPASLRSKSPHSVKSGSPSSPTADQKPISPNTADNSVDVTGSSTSGVKESKVGALVSSFEKLSVAGHEEPARILNAQNTPNTPTSKVSREISHLTQGGHGKKQEEGRLKAKEERELKDCTFKPQLNPSSMKMAASSRYSAINAKPKELLEKLKADNELKDCTFKPQLNPSSMKMVTSHGHRSVTQVVVIYSFLYVL